MRAVAVAALLAFAAAPALAQRDSGALHLNLSVQEGVHVGRQAPAIVLPYATRDSAGPTSQPFDLAKELGHTVVVIFYSGDSAPGAAERWRAVAAHLGAPAADLVVTGISADSLAAHVRFARNLDLPYKLLSDAERSAARQYGAARGRTIEPAVVVIGRDGVVRYADSGFNPLDPAAWAPVDAAVKAAREAD